MPYGVTNDPVSGFPIRADGLPLLVVGTQVLAFPAACTTFVLPKTETSGMVKKIVLRQVGGSVGATLPKDMADRLHVGPGDEVFVVETSQGILITPYDPTFDEAMRAYDRTAAKYRNALRKLAE